MLPPSNVSAPILGREQMARISTSVWIDAVCINQLGLVKKGFQFPLMRSMYGRSEGVSIQLRDFGCQGVSGNMGDGEFTAADLQSCIRTLQ